MAYVELFLCLLIFLLIQGQMYQYYLLINLTGMDEVLLMDASKLGEKVKVGKNQKNSIIKSRIGKNN